MAATRERRFRAMGSGAHVVVVGGPPDALGLAQRRVEDLEARWSRFRPDSEVSALNAAAGRTCAVSPDTWLLLRRAQEGHELTGGRFDPTLLTELEALGYDRSYECLERLPERSGTSAGGAAPGRSALRPRGRAALTLSDDGRSARLAAGIGFDPGGIGKGLAADLVVADLLDAGVDGASVNLGGDLRVEGQAPTSDGWVIAVEDPFTRGVELLRCALQSGAVATSNRRERTWQRDGAEHHHLLDPATGRPTGRGVVAVTVIAGEGWQAEVLTKAAFVAGGPDAAVDALRASGAAGVVVADDGSVVQVGLPCPVDVDTAGAA